MNLDDIQIREFEESSNSKSSKSKRIAKKPKSEYTNFYKHHFERLHREHPKWAHKQITSIIKLLWKKKKSPRSLETMKMRPMKPMTGRRFFLKIRRELGVSTQEGMQLWKRLPKERKNLYNRKGNPNCDQQELKMNTRSTLVFSGLRNSMVSPLSFLNARMI